QKDEKDSQKGGQMCNNEDMKEQIKLAHVLIKRTQKELYLTHAQMRTLYDSTNMNPISRVIKETPVDLIEPVERDSGPTFTSNNSFGKQKDVFSQRRVNTSKQEQPMKRKARQAKTTGAENETWKTGDKANHKVWGVGT